MFNNLVWLALVTLFLLIEFFTVNARAVWLGIGAFWGLVLSMFHAPVWLQILMFFLVGGLFFHFVRPWVLSFVASKLPATPDKALRGHNGVVTTKINRAEKSGAVSIDGVIWPARAVSGLTEIELGTEVSVIRVQGELLVVTPLQEDDDISESAEVSEGNELLAEEVDSVDTEELVEKAIENVIEE